MALALARTLAWALLMLGWLRLGALGRESGPLVAAGVLPIASWLAAIGLAQHAGRGVVLSARALRAAIALLAAITAAALAEGSSMAPFVAALAWGGLVVAASRAVRSLRRGRAPAPLRPAACGSALAWAASAMPSATLLLVGAAGVMLAALVAGPTRGCRSGLFDCALPAAGGAGPRNGAEFALACVRWTMLPMMATLPAMADWCSADIGLDPWRIAGLHLAAMLLPALAWPARPPVRRWIALPLAAALAGPLLWPGQHGLMAASLACAAAWGIAWRLQLAQPARTEAVGRMPERSAAASAWPALAALALGALLDRAGPPALTGLLAGLAALALLGLLLGERRRVLQRRA